MTVNDLRIGESAKIIAFSDEELSLVLNEMGFLLGEFIELTAVAPFGDPICIKSSETLLSIRRKDANSILVKKLA